MREYSTLMKDMKSVVEGFMSQVKNNSNSLDKSSAAELMSLIQNAKSVKHNEDSVKSKPTLDHVSLLMQQTAKEPISGEKPSGRKMQDHSPVFGNADSSQPSTAHDSKDLKKQGNEHNLTPSSFIRQPKRDLGIKVSIGHDHQPSSQSKEVEQI